MKILVTGDREWNDLNAVINALKDYPRGTVLVHGACRGADNACAAVAEQCGFTIRPYPADWTKYKRAAGPIRNQQMLDEEHLAGSPIDLCLAFHNDLKNSRGTRDMITRAKKAGIEVVVITSEGIVT